MYLGEKAAQSKFFYRPWRIKMHSVHLDFKVLQRLRILGTFSHYAGQISGIDSKYGSIKIFADQCGSILINSDQLRSMQIFVDLCGISR